MTIYRILWNMGVKLTQCPGLDPDHGVGCVRQAAVVA